MRIVSGILILILALTNTPVLIAGDILRGGAPAPSQRSGASSGKGSIPNLQAAQNAKDALSRTTQALNAVKLLQAQARQIAAKANNAGFDPNHPGHQLPNVPNGLTVGGLQVAPGVPADLAHPLPGDNPKLWQGANLPTQTTANGKTIVKIKQTSQQALLNWQTFNVGKDTTVDFDQSAGGTNKNDWIAFNKINDPSGIPSQILGNIHAEGQVYLINPNGIIFGGASQINLHALVASSLPINDNLISRGLLNNPDSQFLFSALDNQGNLLGSPAGIFGDITVLEGATIFTPTTADHAGGRVALVGPNVMNNGTISTPDGQTILAAGLQVGLVAHSSKDPSLRGLDAYVGKVAPSNTVYDAGTATNSGLIEIPRGNFTMTGKAVNQLGVVHSTTSVSLNGRIDLLADYNALPNLASNQNNNQDTGGVRNLDPYSFLPTSTGIVTLGAGSILDVLPELSSNEKVVGVQLALASQVNIQGHAIHLAEDSSIIAPNANISLSAGSWKYSPGNNQQTNFVYSGGQIYLDTNAMIYAAGSAGVPASVAENIISAELRGAELADSPLQRNGPLRGATIQIDVRQQGVYNNTPWIGTPLANVSGYVNLVNRTVGELTISGGAVKLNAGDSVVMQQGSRIDVSGGWINYQGGIVDTTRVISNGHILDISQAIPDRIYDGIYSGQFTTTHSKYGISETFVSPLSSGAHFEQGYIYGGNGGSISITAPSMALDGQLSGNTVSGPHQRSLGASPSSLSLRFASQDISLTNLPYFSPTPPKVVFQSQNSLAPVAPFSLTANGTPESLPPDRQANVILPLDLVNKDGFGILTIDNRDGKISVAPGVVMNAPAITYVDQNGQTHGSTITFNGANIDIYGVVTAPGGGLYFSAYDISQATENIYEHDKPNGITPPPDQTRGNFILASTGRLSTAGLLVDDRQSSLSRGEIPMVLNGGYISITAFNENLQRGATLDVSGGAFVSANGKVTYGSGGSILLQAGQDINIPTVVGGGLRLNAELKGYSGKAGASITLRAPGIQIGGKASTLNTLLLSPDFFTQGGFTSYTLSAFGESTGQADTFLPAISMAPGIVIHPTAESAVVSDSVENNRILALHPILMQPGERAPVNLAFNAIGITDPQKNVKITRGEFVMGNGASIEVDPKGSVIINGDTVAVLGSIYAPGGNIKIIGGNKYVSIGNSSQLLPTVDIGPHSILSTAGTTLYFPDARGLSTGIVLPGGQISISGNIVAESGAVLDVSGASGVFDLNPSYTGNFVAGSFRGAPATPTRVDSNGGLIVFTGQQELFVDATLRGIAGGPSAQGGSLTVSSGRYYPDGDPNPPTALDVTLQVTQHGPTIPSSFYPPGEIAIGHPIIDSNGNPVQGQGYFSVDKFIHSGMATLNLLGTVRFTGPITINAAGSISIANGAQNSSGVIYADSAIHLNAPYVSIGSTFLPPIAPNQQQPSVFTVGSQPLYINPLFGTGSLDINARLIDVGNLSLQGIGRASLIAANGDIRGDGILDMAGNLLMKAGQIYPATEVSFSIIAYDYLENGITQNGSITIERSGIRSLPLSAGGQLNIYASVINQGGVLRAPFGAINIGWDGQKTAPIDLLSGQQAPIAQNLTLSANSVTSVSAIDPITGKPAIIPYGTNLNGTSWIDPAGLDITAIGAPQKTINILAQSITDKSGALIDIRGGGDLLAYQWIAGNGGSKDILNNTNSFAVIPGYGLEYAPYDSNYTNSQLKIGDKIFLNASNGLPAGTYTLLPARYALLPGAFLVTPLGGMPVASVALPDGSSLVGGYRYNGLNNAPASQPLTTLFEVASAAVIQSRAQYNTYFANSFMKQISKSKNTSVPNLPINAGHLVFEATQSMSLEGSFASNAPRGALGGIIDLSSPLDILIAAPGTTANANTLLIDSNELSKFDADSLLIGGVRQLSNAGTTIAVQTNNLTIDNAGAPLIGADIILAANKKLTLADNAEIDQKRESVTSSEPIFIGNAQIAGSGDGVLMRVGGNPASQLLRSGVSSSETPTVLIGDGVTINSSNLIIDSTHAMSLSQQAKLTSSALSLESGQISIVLSGGSLPNSTGLILSGPALQNIENSTASLSLLSYSSIDLYGSGGIGSVDSSGVPLLDNIKLHAAQIRGFSTGGDTTFFAKTITLDNISGGMALPTSAAIGSLVFNAQTIQLGAGQLAIDQYSSVNLNSTKETVTQSTGMLTAANDLTITSPLLTSEKASVWTISAQGLLNINSPSNPVNSNISGGLGASLTLNGAAVAVNTNVSLPSGILTIHSGGELVIGNQSSSKLDVGGIAQNFFDLVKYTDAGAINLLSDAGNIIIGANATLNCAAQLGGGNAGSISVSAQTGSFAIDGILQGKGGAGGQNGSFSLDIGSLPSTASIDGKLNDASFTYSRNYRVRNGSVAIDGPATAQNYNLSADNGGITVLAGIDASGVTGGNIDLAASGNINISNGFLSVAAQKLNSAGQGGSITLETINGRISINTAASIDLSVSNASGGTLHLRAPQLSGPDYVAIDPLPASIKNAGSIIIEGFHVFDASADPVIDDWESSAYSNASAFMANAAAIQTRLTSGNVILNNVLHVRPGIEIDSQGDLILSNDLDLSTWRFGQQKAVVDQYGNPLFSLFGDQIFSGVEPGILTLRAKGSITFNGSLTDGFGDGTGSLDMPFDSNGVQAQWLQQLLPRFQDGSPQQSWSYRITAGADMSAADLRRVLPLSQLASDAGSVRIGVNGGTNISNPFGVDAVTDTAIEGHYQVIRTGAGSIDISAGRSVQLLNQFATIYTAGAQAAPLANFDVPKLFADPDEITQLYPAQFSMGGGNVTIQAQMNIEHLTMNNQNQLIADSERQLPMNWLYRRGFVGADGKFGNTLFGDAASTSWWVDFSNFFEGIGALGGGNVTLSAGNNISNIDAVIPTNARMQKGMPDASTLVELGGGDLMIKAGNNIDGGVYYVERGRGVLEAGNMITTNDTRSPSLGSITFPPRILPSQTWLPTTLFLGDSSFKVTARNDVLIGPAANPFWLPQGANNSFWDKSYFSTYSADASIDVSSLGGNITFRETSSVTGPLLEYWLKNVLLSSPNNSTVPSYYQPWLRLVETNVDQFTTVSTIAPGTLRATAYSGDINVIGNLTLFPSSKGTIDLASAGAINGLQPDGIAFIGGKNNTTWEYSRINLSDTDPAQIPNVTSPLGYQSFAGWNSATGQSSNLLNLGSINVLFSETGSTEGAAGVLQTKQALHSAELLHLADPNPVHLYAEDGDISGFTLFSSKATRVIAGRDIADISLYIQNLTKSDVSIVSAGRDITAYDATSPLRTAAVASGNVLFQNAIAPLAGDIQISGPGTLEIFAGHNLELGTGGNNPDGTGVGITSIGNARNPYLPFAGADIIAGAGIGLATSLQNSKIDLKDFVAQFVENPAVSSRYFADLGAVPGISNTPLDSNKFSHLPSEQQAIVALDLFYLVLRDAGRDHNDPNSAGSGNYNDGFKAIDALFPKRFMGDIITDSRDIRTKSGGRIDLFAPGGGLTLASTIIGNPLAPPGIITEDGGNIDIFTNGDVNLGISRIFTLRGGDIVIWSSNGSIAAGSSAKTVQSAPPTRVLVDPQSGDVKTDVAGLATGGGIGVLATVAGVAPGSVDLIAPNGTIDAGDAGIRATGNLNLAAARVLNASNIQSGGQSTGVPNTAPATPNLGSLTAASNTAAATTTAASEATKQQGGQDQVQEDVASIITVEVIGYGGGEG